MMRGITLLALAMTVFGCADVSAQTNKRASDIAEICGNCRLEKVVSCPGHFLEGIVFDRQARMWMVSLSSGSILRANDNGTCSVVGSTGGAPNGAKFHRDGRLFITDRARGLLAFDPATQSIAVVKDAYGLERFRGLNDLIFDRQGGIYFTEPYGSDAIRPIGRVFYLPPDHQQTAVLVADNFAFPNGLALSPDESRLYVNDYARNQIITVPLSGAGARNIAAVSIVFARLNGGNGPDGMTVDAAGNVYVAQYNAGQIAVFDVRGFPYGVIRLPDDAGPGVTNLAFQGGYLYVLEALRGEVWRVKILPETTVPFHLR